VHRTPIEVAAMKRANPETQLQISVMRWLELAGVFGFHVPNGGKRSRTEAAIMKAAGVRAGAADLVIVWTGPHGYARVGFIELKAPGTRGGSTTNQDQFGEDVEALGAPYVVARSIEDVDLALRSWGVPARASARRAG
jgi:hypothetical protein